jgi:enediyne biosynthesis thioesterase
MSLGALTQNKMSLIFEYWRCKGETEELVASGEQQIACMKRSGGRLLATPVPESLRQALIPYGPLA